MEHAESTAQPDAEVTALLERAESDIAGLDGLTTHDQVAGYDRIHDSLVQALARTSDSTGPVAGRPTPGRAVPARPVPGRPGA